MDSEDDPSPPPSIPLQSTVCMQSSNLVAGTSVSRRNENTGPNYAPATFRAPTAWWSGLTVSGPLDQRFQGNFPISPELLAIQNSEQHHVNDNTAFQSIPGNSISSHSQTVDDRTFYYPQELWHPRPEDENLAQAYTWSQCEQPVWYNPGQFPPSFQEVASQPSTELLPNTMPPQEQSAFHECAWIEDNKRCGHLIWDERRKLGMHLSNVHGVQGNDKKGVVCHWEGCNHNMQRGAIGRHIISCHLKTRWTCENCSKTYSRRDAMKKHAKECQAA
ncbi:hypothetical protein BD769DRAFT_1662830 [Suillus cothurnatus]|nr:hypothetical protein BD769DRAFT_1662830 [Suillus cothurnatus]